MPATNVGQVSLDLILNSKEFDTKLNQKLNEVGKTTSNKLNNTFSKLGKTIAGAFAIGAIAKFGKECLDLGSDLQEVQNVVDSTFTTLSEKVNEYASESITKLGMSETAYKRYIGTMGAMSKSFGFTEEEALKMSKTLVELTGDVASFYNLSHDEAYTKMKAVYTGETESLKELGVVMTQAALDQFALSNGFGKTTAKMTEQEKVALRYAFVQDKLKTASGDFIRTQNGWANQTRILAQQFEALKSSIGIGLINALTPVIKVMNILLSKINAVAKGFASLTAKIFGDATKGSSGNAMTESISGIGAGAEGASEAISGMGDSTAAAAKKASKALMGFDEINKLSAPVEDTSSGSGGVGGGAIGGIGEETSAALENANEQETIFEKALDRIITRATELKNIFVEGFKFGLDATGFENSISKIKESFEGIKGHFKDIFDSELGEAFSTMINKIVKSLGEIGGAFVGAGANLAANLLEGFEEFLGVNKGTIKDVLIGVFDGIGNAFEKLSEILVPNMNSIVDITAKIVAGFIVAKVIIGILAGITTAITSIITIFNTLKASLSLVSIGTKLFGSAFAALASPVGLVVAAVAAVVATMVILYNKCEVFRDIVNNTFSVLSEKFQFFKDTLILVGNSVKENLLPKFEEFGNRIKEIWEKWIGPAITIFMSSIMKLIEIVGSLLFDCLSDIAVILGNLANAILPPLMDGIGGFIEIVSMIAAAIAVAIEGLLDWIRTNETVMTVLRAVVDAILIVVGVIGTIAFVVTHLPVVIAAALALIVGYVFTHFEEIKKAIIDLCDKVSTWWNDIWTEVANFFNDIWTTIKTNFFAILNIIKTNFINIWTTIKTNFFAILNIIKTDFTNIWTTIKNFASSVLSNLKTTFTNAWNSIKNTVNTVLNNIKTTFTTIWGNITSFFSSKISAMKDGAISGFNAIKDGASRIFGGLKSLVSGIFESLVGLVKNPINGAIKLINKAIDGLNNVSFDMPDFLGGGHIGFDIPQIPALANGGYVKANQPQLAMIGDNRHQGEIVSPEDKMAEVFGSVLDKYFGNINARQTNNNGTTIIENIVQLDGRTIYKEMKTLSNKESNRTGSKQFR